MCMYVFVQHVFLTLNFHTSTLNDLNWKERPKGIENQGDPIASCRGSPMQYVPFFLVAPRRRRRPDGGEPSQI